MAYRKDRRHGRGAGGKTMLQIEVSGLRAKGKEIQPAEEKKIACEIKGRYEKQTTPYYAARVCG